MRRFFSGARGNAKLMINFFGLSFDMTLIRGGLIEGRGLNRGFTVSVKYQNYIVFTSSLLAGEI